MGSKDNKTIGSLLFYACPVNNDFQNTLSTLVLTQTTFTYVTAKALDQILNYCTIHSNMTIGYKPSNVVLHAHSNAPYLSKFDNQSRSGAHLFLGNQPTVPDKSPDSKDPFRPNNGSFHDISPIMDNILASMTETRVGALYKNT